MHFRYSVPMLLLATGSVSLGATPAQESFRMPPDAQAGEASPPHVVYQWKKTVSPSGQVTEATPVDDLLEWVESGAGTINLDTLEDSAGRSYQMVADAWQESEEGDVHYSIQLVQTLGHKLTEAQIVAGWIEAHPGATAGEIEAFRSRKSLRRERPSPPKLSREVSNWHAQGLMNERIHVTVRLTSDSTPLRLPKIAPNLFSQEPAAALAQMEERLFAIEQRKTLLAQDQATIIAELEGHGGRLTDAHWIINGFDAELTWTALAALAANPRVEHIERFDLGVTDDNDLQDMREAAQIPQLHDEGHTGESGSGKASYNDICLAIIDSDIQIDHPAWDDWGGGPSRLLGTWRWIGGNWFEVATSATTASSHGTKVAGVALADLRHGQDPAITSTAARQARTGFAPEASFHFLEGAGAVSSIEQAVALNPDIINLSISFNSNDPCDLFSSSNDAVDAAMLDGVFFVKSGGNNGNSGSTCNVGNPGAASGSFTVNQLDRSSVPLKEADVTGGASRGGDSLNRGVIAVAAFAGPEAATTAQAGSSYATFGSSSSAAPAVAGTAACLKDHLLDVFGSSIANQVGYLYATMLMSADGQLEDGTYATTPDPMDEVYGAGRLRMRMFNSKGMDSPWRMRLFSRTVRDGVQYGNMPVNPNSSGVNQPLPSDVDRLRTACFWHEPNVESGMLFTADIHLVVEGSNGVTYTSGSDDDPRQHIYLGNVAGGTAWNLRLIGHDVPLSLNSDYYFLQTRRKVYLTVYWEDTDRDDSDGPSSEID